MDEDERKAYDDDEIPVLDEGQVGFMMLVGVMGLMLGLIALSLLVRHFS